MAAPIFFVGAITGPDRCLAAAARRVLPVVADGGGFLGVPRVRLHCMQ